MIARTSSMNLVLMIAGFALWGIALNVLYGTVSLGCELAWHRIGIGPVSLHRIVLVGLWLALLALHVGLLSWLRQRLADTPPHPRRERFIQYVGVACAGLGLVATAVMGSLVIFLSPCAV